MESSGYDLSNLKEIKNKIGLVLGLPMGRTLVRREWALALATQAFPMNTSVMHCVVPDQPVALARNLICEQALEVNAPYIWFLDDDTVCPSGSVRALLYALEQNPEAAAIGAIYCTRTEPPVPVVLNDFGTGAFWNWRVGEVFECAAVGTGCMIVRTEALKKISQPWFKEIDDVTVSKDELGTYKRQETDDIFFCKKALQSGFKILAHGGVLCDHWDTEKCYQLPKDSLPWRAKDGSRTIQS